MNGSIAGLIDVNTCFGFYRQKRLDASAETLMSQMCRHGIGKALTCSLRGVFYDCREGNAETLDVCRRHKNLLPVAVVDPRTMLDMEEEIASVAARSFVAARIFPNEQGWSVEGVAFRKLLKTLDAVGLPLITDASPTSLYNMTADIRIPVLFLSVHYYRLHEALAAFADRPDFYAETRQMVSPDTLELFVKRIGADRLLFGSNLPFDYAGSPVARLLSAVISEPDRDLITSGNAQRIFGIGGEGA